MHLEKIACGAEAALIRHNSRAGDKHSNTNINADKSYLNYNLMQNNKDMERFKNRLSQCSYRKQKNNVRMEEIIITAPKNIKPADLDKFFTVAFRTLQGLTGGKENTVAAYVHCDEKTPHLHFDFVPAIEIAGVLKLSAKKLMDRHKLQVLHPTMQQEIDKAFGHHNYIVVADNPAERAQRSDTIRAYKAKQAYLDNLRQQEHLGETSVAMLMQAGQKAEQQAAEQIAQIKQRVRQEEQQAEQQIAQIQQNVKAWETKEQQAEQRTQQIEQQQTQAYLQLDAKCRKAKEDLDTEQCKLFALKQDIQELRDTKQTMQVEMENLQEEYKQVTAGVYRERAINIVRSDPTGAELWAWAANTAAMQHAEDEFMQAEYEQDMQAWRQEEELEI